MTWFKVDDNFPQHPKVLAIPRRERAGAVGLWTLAGAWCAKNLTDGAVPSHMLEEFASTKKVADSLVKVGLWETTDDGYLFHDWSSPWQPTRAEVMAKREEEARRKAEWRQRRAARRATGQQSDVPGTDEHVPPGQPPDETRDSDVSPEDVTAESRSTRTRPVPEPVSPNGDTSRARSGAQTQTRGTRIPDPFPISDEMRTWGHAQGWADGWMDAVTERFVDYWRGRAGAAGVKLDWPATWRNWLRKEADRGAPVAAVAGAAVPNLYRDKPSWEL